MVHHSSRLRRGAQSEMRDQGLTRPQVLLVLPFREAALRTINTLAALLPAQQVAHRARCVCVLRRLHSRPVDKLSGKQTQIVTVTADVKKWGESTVAKKRL